MTAFTTGTLPRETFRIRPLRGSRRYFLVYIAKNLTEMRRAMRRHTGSCHPRQLACVIGATGKDGRHPGLLGIIFFAQTCLGVGIVAHEMVHAGFRACERQGLLVKHWEWAGERANSPEEHFCDVVEHLNRHFWNEAYARGMCRPKVST